MRALRPARQHDRPGGVLPGADRREPVHRALDAGGARRRVVRAGRRRPPQRPVPRRRAHPRAQRRSGRSSTRASCSASSPTSGHLAEIGGKAVGSFAADATEVFQEGLRIPPVKIVKRDENDMELWRLIMANHRTPRNTWGDLNAQIGSLRVAERRVLRVARPVRARVRGAGRRRADGLLRALDARRDRARSPTASTSSPSRWRTTASSTQPVTFHVTVTVNGDELIVDWTGTDPQVRGPINATYGVTAGATYNAIFHLTDMDIPKNSGAYRPIRIIAPPGLGRERRLPGPVGRRQHRDPPQARRHGHRRARARAARPRRGGRGRHRLQLPLRRRPSEDRRLLRQLPPRGRRLGREVLRRRQRRDRRQERQLPQHAGRDLRDPLPAARARVLA